MELSDLIRVHIETVDQLRSILLLKRNPEAHWEATQIAAKTYLPPAVAIEALTRLEANGLVKSEGEPILYCFKPRTPELMQLMDEVARMDRERPVTLLQTIYERRTGGIQDFTDAFRLRRNKGD